MYQKLVENIPFICFAISGYLLFFFNSWELRVSAAMFYGIGCIILVSRSAVGRLDRKSKKKVIHQLPEVLYEYLPYWYGATAIFLVLITDNPFLQFIAFILIIIAVRNLICRHNNRTKPPSMF